MKLYIIFSPLKSVLCIRTSERSARETVSRLNSSSDPSFLQKFGEYTFLSYSRRGRAFYDDNLLNSIYK